MNVAISVTAPPIVIMPPESETLAAGSDAPSASTVEVASAPSPEMIPPENAVALTRRSFGVVGADREARAAGHFGVDVGLVGARATAIACEEPTPTSPPEIPVVVADGAAQDAAISVIAPLADGSPPLMNVMTEPPSVAVALAPLPAISAPLLESVVALAPSGSPAVDAFEPSLFAS